MRRIKREQTRIEFFKRPAAAGAAHFRAHHGYAVFPVEQMGSSAADVECALNQIARFQNPFGVNHANDHIDRMFLESLELSEMRHGHQRAVYEQRVESLAFRPSRHIGMKSFACFD